MNTEAKIANVTVATAKSVMELVSKVEKSTSLEERQFRLYELNKLVNSLHPKAFVKNFVTELSIRAWNGYAILKGSTEQNKGFDIITLNVEGGVAALFEAGTDLGVTVEDRDKFRVDGIGSYLVPGTWNYFNRFEIYTVIGLTLELQHMLNARRVILHQFDGSKENLVFWNPAEQETPDTNPQYRWRVVAMTSEHEIPYELGEWQLPTEEVQVETVAGTNLTSAQILALAAMLQQQQAESIDYSVLSIQKLTKLANEGDMQALAEKKKRTNVAPTNGNNALFARFR